jgi:hypothetical protein
MRMHRRLTREIELADMVPTFSTSVEPAVNLNNSIRGYSPRCILILLDLLPLYLKEPVSGPTCVLQKDSKGTLRLISF